MGFQISKNVSGHNFGKCEREALDLLNYSIASGIPVALTIVKCWNINYQNHKHTYSHEPHDQNDKSNRCNTLYDFDDWYFSIWQSSMSQEFQWQLSNWVGPLRLTLTTWKGFLMEAKVALSIMVFLWLPLKDETEKSYLTALW